MAQDSQDPLDREEAKEQRRLATERERETQQEDIRWLMGQTQGRRIMSRLLDVTGVFRSSFTGNSETFFREGARNVGLTFLNDAQALAPGDFITMLEEYRTRTTDSSCAK